MAWFGAKLYSWWRFVTTPWCAALVGVIFFYFSSSPAASIAKIENILENGSSAKGVVTKRFQEEKQTSKRRNRTRTAYYIRYAYERSPNDPSDRRAWVKARGLQEIDRSVYENIMTDDAIIVRYLTKDLKTSSAVFPPTKRVVTQYKYFRYLSYLCLLFMMFGVVWKMFHKWNQPSKHNL